MRAGETPTPPVPDWLRFLLADTSLLQAVFWLVALISLIVAVVKLWPALGRFVQIVNATAGLPAFIDRTDKRLDEQDTQIAEIHHQLHLNGGGSVKDGVNRVEEGVAGLYNELTPIKTKLDALAAVDDRLWDEIEKTGGTRPRGDH